MASRWAAVVAAVVLGLTAAGCTPSPERSPAPEPESATTRRMVDYLADAVDLRQFRGTVEVRLGDQVLLRRGFDRARVGTGDTDGVANGPDTRFRIASLTKQFTALAVLILQERGRLRVTDAVCAHLSDCPAAWRAITVEQLLTHTSGLYDYMDSSMAEAAAFFARIGTREPSPEQLTEVVASRPLEFAPGARWDYNSSGYVLLGRVVERLSGLAYGDFLRTEILDPLGMADSGYEPGLASGERYAVGYHDWTTAAETLADSVYYAGGGMYSTVRDLDRWNQFLMTGDPAVVDRETLDELLRARVETTPLERYGFGMASRDANGEPAYFHEGWVAGFTSYNEV
ncbi:MAG: serine hydrolase domain-containing protein, partial [Actinophytocola sp.]|uniref:serine hydrolase domain-containing protein n=1 Tax=Actinophytocola sp. TaxID=1872138 RepID=UPI003D6C059B